MAADQYIPANTTSKIVNVSLRSSTTGQFLTGLTAAGMTIVYIREGAAPSTVTVVTGTLNTFVSGGWVETSKAGHYQFSVPNAAVASGVSAVKLVFSGTGVIDKELSFVLTGVNVFSANAFMSGVNGVAPPTNWNLESIDGSGRVLLQPTQTGVTIPTVTTLTGHTAQTGDAFARIGSNGAGLTAIGDTRLGFLTGDAYTRIGANGAGLTALGDTRIANLDAAVTSRLAPTTAGRTLDVSATGEAGLDFDNIKQATGATTLTNITVPTVTTLTGHTAQTGDAFARIGANGAGLTALGDTRLAFLTGDAFTRIGAGGAGLTAIGDTRLGFLTGDAFVRIGSNGSGLTGVGLAIAQNFNNTGQTNNVPTLVKAYDTGQAPLQPTVAGRALDVSTTGEAGLDFDNIKQASGATTLNNLTIPTVTNTGTVTGNVNGSVGSVTGEVNISGGSLGDIESIVQTDLVSYGAAKPGDVPTAAQNAAAVRTNLTTELGRLDTNVGSRAATGDAMTLTSGERTSLALAIWGALTSGFSVVGSIGKRISDNLNATVGSRAVAGDAMTLTTGERTAIANEVEAQIIDETDSEKVLTAITNKIAAVNPDLSGLTLAAIAARVRTELAVELADVVALEARLTAARALLIDKLNVTGNVASQGDVTTVGTAVASVSTQVGALNNLSSAQAQTAAAAALTAYAPLTTAQATTNQNAAIAAIGTPQQTGVSVTLPAGVATTAKQDAIKAVVDTLATATALTSVASDVNDIQGVTDELDTMITGGVFTEASLVNAPAGGGGGGGLTTEQAAQLANADAAATRTLAVPGDGPVYILPAPAILGAHQVVLLFDPRLYGEAAAADATIYRLDKNGPLPLDGTSELVTQGVKFKKAPEFIGEDGDGNPYQFYGAIVQDSPYLVSEGGNSGVYYVDCPKAGMNSQTARFEVPAVESGSDALLVADLIKAYTP